MLRNLFFIALCILSFETSFAQNRPIVGAIRWDAWLGKSDAVGIQLNKSLGPNHWHYRLPFYAKVINENSVDIDGTSQTVADAEIEYAAYSKLDYFAFLMYDDRISLSNGLHKYLTSSKKDMIRFCVIMNNIATESTTTSVKRVLGYFQQSNYQHVLGGRPLVYTYNLENSPELAKALKDSCSARNWPKPYIVNLQYPDNMPSSSVYDAISCYWYNGTLCGGSETGAPYSRLMSAAQVNWQVRAENGTKQIPLVTLGVDGRPLIENPVTWTSDPASIYEKYFETAKPHEIAAHLGEAFNFIENNPLSCEANTVLMYAWNENAEGGWLVPTLENDTDINTSRIDSLRSFLLNYTPGSSKPVEQKLTGIVSGSADSGNVENLADKAFDGKITTYSELKTYPRFAGLEFAQTFEISKIRYIPRAGYEIRMNNAVFQVSKDGSNWTNVYTVTATPSPNVWTEIIIDPAIEARYARLWQSANWLTATEIEFYGKHQITSSAIFTVNRDISVFPNPTVDLVTVSISNPSQLVIRNGSGMVVLKSKMPESETISLSEFPSGIYFLELKNTQENILKKLIKK